MATSPSEHKRTQISVWLLEDDLKRADRLVHKMANDRMLRGSGPVNRSVVLRLALTYGLDVLEKKYP